MENNATTQVGTPNAPDGAQGIWKATLGEKEIIMAVNQSDQSLFGLAKFEGDNPWNGAIAGSLSANAVSFSLAAMEDEVLASIYISATLEGDSMLGFFIRSDSNDKASRGDFTATLISPDTSGYIPAVVTAAPLPAVQTEQVSTEQKNGANASEEREKPASAESKSRFKDVTELEDLAVTSVSEDFGKWRVSFNWSEMDEYKSSVSHGDSTSGKTAIATDALTLVSASDKSTILKVSVIMYSRSDASLINYTSMIAQAKGTLAKSNVCKEINVTGRVIDGRSAIFARGLKCPLNEPVYVAVYPVEYHLDRPGGILASNAVGLILSTYNQEATERFINSVKIVQIK